MTEYAAPDVREAVGVFQSEKDLQAAIDDLLTHGFDRAEISLLASIPTVEKELGSHFRSVTELEDNDAVPTSVYIPTESIGDAQGGIIGTLVYVGALAAFAPVVVSGGALAAALLALAVGGGGGAAIGTVLAKIIGQHHADYIADQLEKGGLLLWVRTWDEDDEKRAVDILSKHSGTDVHVHGLPAEHPELEERYNGPESKAEKMSFGQQAYIRYGEGEFYAFGSVFPEEEQAKAHITWHAHRTAQP